MNRNINMDNLKTHCYAGQFSLLRYQIGWSFYPITFRGKKYVVDLRLKYKDYQGDIKTICSIFDYGEERKLFRKHRRNKLWTHDVSVIKLDNDISLILTYTSAEELKLHLPKIMKAIFKEYEADIQRKTEEELIITNNMNEWDGVIDN